DKHEAVLETSLSKGKRIPLPYPFRAYHRCYAGGRISRRPLESALRTSLRNAGAISEKRGQVSVNQRRARDSLQIAWRFERREECVRNLASRYTFLAVARGNIARPVTNVLTVRPILCSQKNRRVPVLVSANRA